MKKSVIVLMVLALGATFAAASQAGTSVPVKLYYGLPGSNDYILGTTGPDNPADAWLHFTDMPSVMMDNCATSDAAYSYALTGYAPGNPRFLYRHAVGSTTWETKAPPPVELSNGGCAIVGDTLYYCSGYSYGTGGLLDTLLKYSISGNTWTTAPGPFTGTTYNWQPFILACAGKVYYISGCNAAGSSSPTVQTWCYTPGSGWSQKANMNQGRVFAMGWTYHDTIWMAGGNVNNVAVNHTEFYDPAANVWTVDHAKFPTTPIAVWGAGSGVITGANTGFIAGGVFGSALCDTAMFFDLSTHQWSLVPGLYARTYRTAGVGNEDGKALLYGGSSGGFNPTATCQYTQFTVTRQNDLGVDKMNRPDTMVAPGAVTPKLTVKNYGLQPQSDFLMGCWIDSAGTRVYDQTAIYSGALAPGASDTVVFGFPWNAANGIYNVTMFTQLDGDERPSNDTLRRRVRVPGTGIAEEWYTGREEVPCEARPSVGSGPVSISYTLPATAHVSLGVYDASGNMVRTLVHGVSRAGTTVAVWNRTANDGRKVARGTYFHRLTVNGRLFSGKFIVLD